MILRRIMAKIGKTSTRQGRCNDEDREKGVHKIVRGGVINVAFGSYVVCVCNSEYGFLPDFCTVNLMTKNKASEKSQ